MDHLRIARPTLVAVAVLSLGAELQAPVAAPGFSAWIDGRPFEPTSAFATIGTSANGPTLRVIVDEVASSCDDLEDPRGRRIVLGPFPYRAARPIPAAIANASYVRTDPDGRVETSRFARGSIRIRDVSREPPTVPFDLRMDLEESSVPGDHADGEVRVTPCVLELR